MGNTQLEHNPSKDHVKFAQAAYLIEKAAKYVTENKGARENIPFICGGDFNSLPISSVLSAWYGENIAATEEER